MNKAKNNKFKIILGDLRHETVGRHSVFMPIGIGYITSYILSKLKNRNIEIHLYDRLDEITKAIEKWKPNLLGLSNYCWNSDLSSLVFKYAKKLNFNIICVAGGPEFPNVQEECKEYLIKRKEIDFYIYGEGEITFTNLVKKLLKKNDLFKIKTESQDGIMSIHPEKNNLVIGKPASRLKNLDEIPSPYLTGLFDSWFNGVYAPSIETNRGCPFSCTYCHTGDKYYNVINNFSLERIKKELEYMAKKMSNYPNILLSICDTNFGMYKRDEKIATYLGELQKKYNWPKVFDATTGKANYQRILKIINSLGNKLRLDCAVQSLNPKTLEIIKRKNIPINKYRKLQKEIKKQGLISIAEFIMPLPKETKTSFLKGIKEIMNSGVEYVVPYTTMLLKATPLNSKKYRKKYNMQTKFRIIPKRFSEYKGKKCFETEEICISTDTFSFSDYLDCRGFTLISSLLGSKQIDLITRHLREFKISNYDYLYSLWKIALSEGNFLNKIYNEYIEETKKELWNSKESIYEYFSKSENYEKLLNGELGDNLLRKYKTKILLEYFVPISKLFYLAIQTIIGKKITKEISESLEEARQWMIAIRNVNFLLTGFVPTDISILRLSYDIMGWYFLDKSCGSLTSFKKLVEYKIYYDTKKIKEVLKQRDKLFGQNRFYSFGMLLIDESIKELWRKCELYRE